MSMTRSRWMLLAGASVVGLAGCLGSGPSGLARLVDDPLIGGGRPLPPARTARDDRESPSDDLTLPPIGTSTPAALAGGKKTPEDPRGAVALGGPRAVEPKGGPITPASGFRAAETSEGSYEQLQKQLLAHGVVWQQLKTGLGPDEWSFECEIPDPQRQGLLTHFDGKAVGDNGLAAIRAVLADIESAKKQRGGR